MKKRNLKTFLLYFVVFLFFAGAVLLGIYHPFVFGSAPMGDYYSRKWNTPTPYPTETPIVIPNTYSAIYMFDGGGNKMLLKENRSDNHLLFFRYGLITDEIILYVEGNDLKRYDLSTGLSEHVYTNPPNYGFSDFEYDFGSNSYFVSTFNKETWDKDMSQHLVKINKTDKIQKEVTVINAELFSSAHYLFGFQDTDVVYTKGGDGCGGGGTIYTIQNGNKREFLKHGVGCVADPRLLSYDKNSLSIILGEAEVDENDAMISYIKRIYKKSVVTGAEVTIANIPNYRIYKSQILNSDKTKQYFISDNSMLVLNLNSGEVTSYPITDDAFKNPRQNLTVVVKKSRQDCMVVNFEKKLHSWCLDDGTKKVYDYEVVGGIAPSVLGFVEDKLIVLLMQEEKH